MKKKLILALAFVAFASNVIARDVSWGNALVEVDANGVAILNTGPAALPAGAATEAKQDSAITALGLLGTEATLAALSAKIAALGQATMAGSAPVVIASDQSAFPVNAVQSGAWTVTANIGTAGTLALDTSVDGIEALITSTNALLTTIDADTGALAGTVAGSEQQVDIVAPLPAGSNVLGGVTQSGTWTFTAGTGSLVTLEDTAAAFKTVTGGSTSINTNETHCWNCDDSYTASGTIPGIAVTTERITSTGTTAIAAASDHVALVGLFIQQDTDGGGASLCEIEVDGTPVVSFRFDRSDYYPIGEKFLDLDAAASIDVVITQGGGGSFDGAVTVSYYAE